MLLLLKQSNCGKFTAKLDDSLFNIRDSSSGEIAKIKFLLIIQQFNALIDREESVLNFDKSDDEDLDNELFNAPVVRIREGLGIRPEDLACKGKTVP